MSTRSRDFESHSGEARNRCNAMSFGLSWLKDQLTHSVGWIQQWCVGSILAMVEISCAFGIEKSWWLHQGRICFAKISAILIQTRTQLFWALFEKLKRLKEFLTAELDALMVFL